MIKSSGPNSSEFVKGIMNQVSSLVETTYGPFGGFVVLSNGETSVVTKDGVSVIRALVSENKLEQAVIKVIQEAAQNTLSKAGDGTTTTIVMANKILEYFHQSDYMRKDTILATIKKNIRKKSIPVDIESDKLKTVALTATAGDDELSSVVIEAFAEAKENGISGVIAEPRIGDITHVETVEGVNFTGNMIDNIFYENQDNRTKTIKNGSILFSSTEISGEDDIVELITTCVNNGIKDLILIAPSFAMTALSALAINHRVSINVTAMVIDGGDSPSTKMAIEAIATAVGGKIVGEESGIDIGDVTADMLTEIENMTIHNKSVTISGSDSGDQEIISQYIDRYEKKLRVVSSDEERDKLKTLISILKKKMIKVIIGGNTLNSITERKDRADDCINSVELSLKGGVVPGAGYAYANMASGSGCRSSIDEAVEKVSLIINGGKTNGSTVNTLDPTIVAETVAEQALELAFILGMTKSVVLTQ